MVLSIALLALSGCTTEQAEAPSTKATEAAASTAAKVAKKQPKHIIVIMTDDQGGWDYGFMGNQILETPNLDAMASRSARLSRFYVSPVCAPTRASVLTGRYNYRTRVIDTWAGHSSMDPNEITLAEVLGDAGYTSGLFGKWHLGDSYPMRPQDQGFDEVLMHLGGGIGQSSDPIGAEGKYTDPTLFHNGEEVLMKGYITDIIFDKAADFIANNVKNNKASFTYIATNAPHGPYHDVPMALLKKYQGKDVASTLVREKDKKNKKMVDTTARVYAMIENIDDNVGKLFQRLKDLDAFDNTLVLFLNDNGPNTLRYVGETSEKKTDIGDGGIRSPLLAHWPTRLKAGTVNDRIAAHYDLFPTILSAAGIALPKHKIDGVNLLPLLENNADNWPDRKLYLQWHRGASAHLYEHATVIGQTHKLSYKRKEGIARLHNLLKDPGEHNDISKQQPAILEEFVADYEAWFKDVGSTRPDNYAPPKIHVGNKAEPRTLLTSQDWINLAGTPYGSNPKNTIGNWPVIFDRAGSYNFTVYPSAVKSDQPTDLDFSIAGQHLTIKLDAGVTVHTFKNIAITAGEQTVAASIKPGKIKIGVHQIHITRN
tara:strand:- start:515 stop:2305 length:1791 start_codon:yes stop_codon:yes gene_type:complete